MKTIKKSLIYFATAAVSAVGLTSCSDFLTEYSQDLAKISSWEDLDEVLLGDAYMHSTYIEVRYSSIQGLEEPGLDILHLMSDEMVMSEVDYNDNLGYQNNMFAFYTWQQDTGYDRDLKYRGGDESYWTDLYKRINVCNMVIALADEQPENEINDAVQKERVKGEAYFLRGMFYFYLANLYAQPYDPATAASTPGVPVKLTEYVEDKEFLRETLEYTYEQIVSDFTDAARCLEGKTAKSKYHADETAANLMLSRVYLYMQDWDNAITYANKVLAANSSLRDIRTVATGDNSVSISSPETIFSMGHYMIAADFADDSYGDEPAFYISDDMVALFTRDDYRSTRYIGRTQYEGYSNAFMKFNLQRGKWGGMSDVSSYCLLRTPEAYLNLAEAQAYKGLDTDAQNTLARFLPSRMQSNTTVSLQGNDLIDFIRDERAREFLLEGQRWFDLRRYTVCQPYKWSKTIEHKFVYFSGNYRNPISYIDYYYLEKNDAAYTLPIPRSVREQQVSIGNNNRPARQPNRVAPDDDDDDDWDDDDDDWDW